MTQVAVQVEPAPQAIPFCPAHGSGWQIPPRHTSPDAQVDAQPPELPPPDDEPPAPVVVLPPFPLFVPPVPVVVRLPPLPLVVGPIPVPPVPLFDCFELEAPQPAVRMMARRTRRAVM